MIKVTGVGSRETPKQICKRMSQIAKERRNVIWRSGGAKGADQAFEAGAEHSEIYIPWMGFNGYSSIFIEEHTATYKEARKIAQHLYPIVFPTRKHELFMTRNVFQVIGPNPKKPDPSDYLVCWTPDGCTGKESYKLGRTGGTGMAILVAEEFGVPVTNLFNGDFSW